MKKAIFPGSFDPLHKGHFSIIKKAIKLFDLIVVVANNPEKKQTDLNERFKTVRESLANDIKVVKLTSGLISQFAKENNINYLVRSARDSADYNYELMLAQKNKELNDQLETVLIMPEKSNIKIRSSIMPKK